MWRSLVAHLHGVQGVEGSNPFTPTIDVKSPVTKVTGLFAFQALPNFTGNRAASGDVLCVDAKISG